MNMKIGVTGKFCAGKDTFAEYLINKGFHHISLSDILRNELRKKEIEITRENLQKIGTELREREGNGVLAKLALENIKDNGNYVITSIRNPLEVKELSNSKNLVLINIEASAEKRFQRLVSRERNERDAVTFKEFMQSEEKELKSSNESGQRIQDCIDMAKFTIVNDRNIGEFYRK